MALAGPLLLLEVLRLPCRDSLDETDELDQPDPDESS
jgi:hypothetical protein